MRKGYLFLLMAMITFVNTIFAQQPNIGVIPTPRQVTINKGACQYNIWYDSDNVKEEKVTSLPVDRNIEQAYQIDITEKGITIKYVDTVGYQNAQRTVEQLKMIYRGKELPCMTILDWPAYKYRLWMDDQSRGPVPNSNFRDVQWNRLTGVKYNHSNYYTEHTLYQAEFPDLTTADNSYYVVNPDEIINFQLFAHAEKTLRIPYYQYLMDSKHNFNPALKETYDFLGKRIRAAIDRIPDSPWFIIDCDETEQLGSGRAKKYVDSIGADEAYVRHINRIYDTIHRFGKKVVMWGDIVAKKPEMMKKLSNDIVYIMWAYDPLDSYNHLLKPFKEQGNPFWVAPSVSHHSCMMPNPNTYMKNIANLARDGYKAGADGFMNTSWDDDGESLFDNSWHGFYWGAEMAWNPIISNDPEELKHREEQFNQNFERLFYGDTSNITKYVQQLYAVGALEFNPNIGNLYRTAALGEPLWRFNSSNVGEGYGYRMEEVRHLLDALKVDSLQNPHVHYALMRMIATVDKWHVRDVMYMMLHDTSKHDCLAEDCKVYAKDYLQRIFNLKREYLRLWDHECGEYERYIVCNRFDDLAREILEMDRHVYVEVKNEGVTLKTLYSDRPIYYTLDGSEPTTASTVYIKPFKLDKSATLKAIAYNEYDEGVITEQYLLSHSGMGKKITLNTKFSTYKDIYSGGGNDALIDGQLGSNTTYADGHWQGYWGDSINAVINFGEKTEVSGISMRFMQNTFDWILAPTRILIYVSKDGKKWTLAAEKDFKADPRETGMRLRNYSLDFKPTKVHYMRVVVPNPGPLPIWHPAFNQPSYMFTDEIVVR